MSDTATQPEQGQEIPEALQRFSERIVRISQYITTASTSYLETTIDTGFQFKEFQRECEEANISFTDLLETNKAYFKEKFGFASYRMIKYYIDVFESQDLLRTLYTGREHKLPCNVRLLGQIAAAHSQAATTELDEALVEQCRAAVQLVRNLQECTICKQQVVANQACVALPCGHSAFCYDCATRWNGSVSSKCALCREEVQWIVNTATALATQIRQAEEQGSNAEEESVEAEESAEAGSVEPHAPEEQAEENAAAAAAEESEVEAPAEENNAAAVAVAEENKEEEENDQRPAPREESVEILLGHRDSQVVQSINVQSEARVNSEESVCASCARLRIQVSNLQQENDALKRQVQELQDQSLGVSDCVITNTNINSRKRRISVESDDEPAAKKHKAAFYPIFSNSQR